METKTLLYIIPIFIALILKVIVAIFVCWFFKKRNKTKDRYKVEPLLPKIIVEENVEKSPPENTYVLSKPKNQNYSTVQLTPRPVQGQVVPFNLRKSRSTEVLSKPKIVDRQISVSMIDKKEVNPDYDNLTLFSSRIKNNLGINGSQSDKKIHEFPEYCNLSVVKYNPEQKIY